MSLAGLGEGAYAAEPAPAPPPSDEQCPSLPDPKPLRSFRVGEELDFILDALGARAGRMSMRVLRPHDRVVPVEVRAETNSFFSKIRKVRGQATSYIQPWLLRPVRYSEE